MHEILDLERYPLDKPGTADWKKLVADCQSELERDGLFNLPGFVNSAALETAVAQLKPILRTNAYKHARRHNIYFKTTIKGLPELHPALTEFETSNRTLCADQLKQGLVTWIYEWAEFSTFLSAVLNKPVLYKMDDPLARVNVMGYNEDCALNWHFDRSEFTTTLLLQAPLGGGDFEYDRDLRSDTNPNYEGVADLLKGRRIPTRLSLSPGTLNVFRGKNTAHRVTPVRGDKERIIAVFSYYERPGVNFSAEERLGFYGRPS